MWRIQGRLEASWLPNDADNPATAALNPATGGPGVNDDHFHPSVSRQILTYVFSP